jgi:hypothetical protein
VKFSGDNSEPSPADWVKLSKSLPPGMLSLLKVLADPRPINAQAWRAVIEGVEFDVGMYHVVFFGATITLGDPPKPQDPIALAELINQAQKELEQRLKEKRA